MIQTEEISNKKLIEILKSKPESELVSLLEEVFIYNDTEPLSEEERNMVAEGVQDYYLGNVVEWKN